MLLSKDQQRKFWREWSAACQAQGWKDGETKMNSAEIEQQRYLLLERAGFQSLTEVDQLEGFDKVLKEIAILQNDLTGTVRADQMALTRLKFAIQEFTIKLGGARYVLKITYDLFKTSDLDALSEAQLTVLHHTLANRTRRKSKPKTLVAAGVGEDNVPF
jgi:hypothetical protein